MKIILTENQYHYIRRLSIIDKLIERSLHEFGRYNTPGMTVDKIINFVATDVTELYFFRYSEEIYIGGEQYDELSDFLKKYLQGNWRERIQNKLDVEKKKNN